MSKSRVRIRSQKRSKREHPDDRGRLLMDAIYRSTDPEVDNYYKQVVKEEQDAVQTASLSIDAYLDRVHMRMGARFFQKLSPVMQKRFCAEYPLAFIGAASNGSVQMSTAV